IVVAGDAAAADRRGPLVVAGCGPPVTLGPGDHVVRTRLGRDTGIDLDRLVLSSPGRAPAPATTPAVPRVRVRRQTPTTLSLRVEGAVAPFRLVLGESWNKGWTARVRRGP